MVCVHGACVVRRASSPKGRGGGVGSYGTPSEKGLQVRIPSGSDSESLPITPDYSSP